MGCVASKPSIRSNDVLVRVPDEQAPPATNPRQSLEDAYDHAASLEVVASEDSTDNLDARKIYGPDGYELVGQLGVKKTGTLKLMRNRRTKELVVARCLSRGSRHSST
jgi:hypothetical protein